MRITKSDFAVGLLTGSLYLYGWLLVCGLWKLITLALNIEYKWLIATCVWVAIHGTWRQFVKYVKLKNDTSYISQENVKTGDKVRANKFAEKYNLTPGREYTVLKHYGERYAVTNDDGIDVICSYKCFARTMRGWWFR